MAKRLGNWTTAVNAAYGDPFGPERRRRSIIAVVTEQAPARPLRASIEIAASPSDVWGVVSDVRRTGEWSPECSRVVTVGGVRAGTWLLGVNRRGGVRWLTVSRIVGFDPASKIAWKVLTSGSLWTYRLEPTGNSTRLIETRETPKGVSGVARWFTRRFLGGQRSHDDELEAGMASGLERIKSIVES